MRILKELTIEVIKKCNTNCIYCSSLSEVKDDIEMDLISIKSIVQFAKQKGCNEICLSGGEPLLKNDILQIIDYVIQRNLKVAIYTSGNANFDSLFEYIERHKIHSGNFKLIFNYPSYEQISFQRIRNEKDFSVENLNALIYRSLQYNLSIEVHIVPCKLNLNTLYETISFLKRIGVQKVSLLRLVFQGRAENMKDSLSFNRNDLIRIIDKIKRNLCDDQFSLRVGIPFSNLVNKSLRCTAGYSKLIIKWDGEVYPCEAFKEAPDHESYSLGNIGKNELEDIWSNSENNTKLITLKDHNDYSCDSCPAQNLYFHEPSY